MTGRKTERWFYAGRRQSANKPVDAWYDPAAEKTMLFSKSPGVIGSGYDVDVTRGGDRLTMHGLPKFVEADAAPVDLVEGWKAEDADAYHQLERARAEKRAAGDDAVQDALDVLRRHFRSCRTYSAKWGFAQWVAAEVARPPREP